MSATQSLKTKSIFIANTYLNNFHRNTDIKFNPKALKFTHLVKCKITQNSYKLQEYLALQLTIG